jgi:arylsulfatase
MNTFLSQGPALAALANTPLNGFKMTDYEGGIASPLIAWWPRGIQNRGRISHRLTHLTDIMATCLDLAGVSYPSEFEGRKIIASPGKSFVSVIRDEDDAGKTRRALVWPHALQDDDWKLVLENPATPELYHIRLDRSEQKNLATEERRWGRP